MYVKVNLLQFFRWSFFIANLSNWKKKMTCNFGCHFSWLSTISMVGRSRIFWTCYMQWFSTHNKMNKRTIFAYFFKSEINYRMCQVISLLEVHCWFWLTLLVTFSLSWILPRHHVICGGGLAPTLWHRNS